MWTAKGGNQWESERQKERVSGGDYDRSTSYKLRKNNE
jgi:hypothetical protein